MGDPAKRRATYDDVVAAPNGLIAELIHGVLVTQPRPAVPHARAASRLGAKLGGPFDLGEGGPGGWVLLDEPELHLAGGHVLVPDLAGWRRARMQEVPMAAAALELAPDWVCEVLSPGTEATDRADKVPLFAAESVGHVWLVDPRARTLEVRNLDGPTYRLLGTWRDGAVLRAVPFDAVELDLAVLWAT